MALIEEMERSGNWLFRFRSYLPLLLYIMAFVVIAMDWDQDIDHSSLVWSVLCLAIALLGQVIRACTVGYTPKGTSGRNTNEGQVAETLNTTGIYSLVRHPLYLGNFFMWLGIIMYVGNWWFTALCAMLFWVYYERIMFAEEAFLRRKFSAQYAAWSKNTPAFFPNFGNYKSSGLAFSMKNVLKREYNGFFAMFLSFSMLNALKNYKQYETLEYGFLLDPIWQFTLPLSLLAFIVLRSLKKYTGVLNVKGREYEV